MKSHYNSKYRVVLFVLNIIFGLNSSLLAQANYSGGSGGGYSSYAISASTSIQTEIELSKKSFDVSIFPNPLKSSDVLKAKISGVEARQKITVIVTDMIGSRLLVEEVEAASEITINIPHERLSKGIYLITFQIPNGKVTRRFSYGG